MIKNFIHILFLLISINAFPQNFSVADYRKELNIKIDIIAEKRIEKGVEILNQAVSIEAEALEMLSQLDDTTIMFGMSASFKRAIRRLLQSSDKYNEGHLLIYNVFSENCEKFQLKMRKMNHYASGMNKAKYYERKGVENLTRATDIRSMLPEADKPQWIQYKMHEALELEKLGIRDKGRALQIYQDFPVEYNYGWEHDVTDEELKAFFKNPAIKLPPDEIFKKKATKANEVVAEEKEGKVEFRVQIAAHTVIIDTAHFAPYYRGNNSIKQVKEGSWFKYQIGIFDNFADADQLRVACRIPRAFVVAYQGTKKLTIKQSLAILQKLQ